MEIDNELLEYIFQYYPDFFSANETLAHQHAWATAKTRARSRKDQLKSQLNDMFSNDSEVLKLLDNGFKTFRLNTAKRIYNEHKDDLNLNLCPKCLKIARTPKAKQCRFCFHNWH